MNRNRREAGYQPVQRTVVQKVYEKVEATA